MLRDSFGAKTSLRYARAHRVPLLVLWYEDVERHPELFREVIFPFLGWDDWEGHLHSDHQKRNVEIANAPKSMEDKKESNRQERRKVNPSRWLRTLVI